MLENLKQEVAEANLALWKSGLVTLTWGNVSGLDRAKGLAAIKPSGVDYEELTDEDIVVLDLEGTVVEGRLNPSSDTPTHLALYREFDGIGGITHTHSVYATGFAQACRELPCFGTTHADHFYGTVPITRALSRSEVEEDYVGNTGRVIVECFGDRNPLEMPAVLAAHHGPFTWGRTALDSVKNSIALETCAQMAVATLELNPQAAPLPAHYLQKHYLRKHGPNATYGQAGHSG